MRKKIPLLIMLLGLVLSPSLRGQIISQYIETNSGSTPKGIEIWNNTASVLDFSTNNLVIEKGTNGATPSVDFTLSSGTLAVGEVLVIGTTDLQTTTTNNGAAFHLENFTFNGDDALVVKYGGVTTDVFGDPGNDPGSAWDGNGVSTRNQNIELNAGITTGTTTGFTDPSTRFSTNNNNPSGTGGDDGFGIAPAGGGGSTKPEPSNHVASFAAAANGAFQIDLTWSDNDGAEAADGFLILGKTGAGTYASVADGSAVSDDSDWTDNNFALNVGSGVETANISGLTNSTSYDFIIYPYTNSGANIDFKTTATVPTVTESTTGYSTLPYSQDFSAAGVPSGWTFTDFTIENSSNAGGSANEAELSFSNDNPGISSIVSEPLNTNGSNLIDLSWKQDLDYFESGSGADYVIKVQTSTDGTSYNDVYTKTVSADETATESIQIGAADGAGSTSLYIRWLYFTNGNRFSYWRIDDISASTATVPTVTIADNSQPAAGNIAQGSLDQILSAFSIASADNSTELNTVDISINGTFDSDDIDNFQLFYAASNSFAAGTQIGSDITGNGNGTTQALSFSGLTQNIADGATGYFWVVVDVNAAANAGNTLTAQAPSFTFSSGNVTNNASAAGTQTIISATPNVTWADNGTQITAASVDNNSTNNVLASFQLGVSSANADLDGVNITTSGTYTANDVENLKIWYSTDNSFDAGTDSELANIAAPTTAGSQSFSGFNQIITNGNTGYFFITVDFPCDATAGNTINVASLDHTDLSFNGTTNTSGSATASGAQTIQDISPDDVTGLSATGGTSEAVISWTNPSCFDELIVVAHTATISGIPSGTYTANSQDFTDGTNPSFPTAGKVVYNGTGTTTTITGLTNGTQYFFKVFARKGSNWNSGVEDNATPNVPPVLIISQYYEGASNDKWLEITNIGTSVADLTNYYLGLWFNTNSPSGNASSDLQLSSVQATLNPGASILIQNGSASLPNYTSGTSSSVANFNGNDPIALMQGGEDWSDRIDCIYNTNTWGSDKSFYRKSSVLSGNTGISTLDGTGEWTEVTNAAVDGASSSATEYLGTHVYTAPGSVPAPSALSISSLGLTSFDISWTKPSGTFGTDWDGVLVFVSDGSNSIDLSASGQDGIDYTANLAYGSGTFATDAGANDNAYCVANQTTDADGNITVTNLTTGTTYYVYAYAYKEVTGNNDDDEFSSEVSGGSATPANLPSAGDIVITEIMYNSSNAGSDDEWIEIYNNSGSAINMNSSWRLTYDANNFDFGDFTFAAGTYYTIAVGSGGDGDFNTGNSFTPDTNTLGVNNADVAGTNASNNLTNSSDPITIVYDPSGASVTIDAVTYDDGAPWPTAADGDGPSLTLIDVNSDNSLGASWRASYGTGGTPGADTLTALVYDAGAWNATGVPNSSTGGLDATVKTGQSVSISADVAVSDLTIENAATLTISAGEVLTVNGDIANNGTVVIESAATLLQTKATDANTGTGTYSVSREFTARNQTRFSMWSSPVSNEDIEDAFSASNPNDLYEFDAANQNWSAYASGVMNAGEGYAATPTLNATGVDYTDSKTFEGSINNGDVSVTVNNLRASDYVLLGNPYPSALDFAAFAADHSDILATVYYWDASTPSAGDAQYGNWNAAGQTNVPNSRRNNPSSDTRSMQGFFVQVDPLFAGGSINFTFQNDMRTSGSNTNAGFFKTETRERAWLNLSTDSAANQILVMFDDRATNGFDRLFDAPIYKASQFHSFYSQQDTMEYSIQGIPYIQPGTAKVLPVGVDAWYQGLYTISLDSLNNWDANNVILLVDSLNGNKVDLTQNDYQFMVNQLGVIKNRLYLVFGTDQNVGLDKQSFEQFFSYQDENGDLVISDPNAMGFTQFELRNLGGQLILSHELDAHNEEHKISTESLSTGVYLIRVMDQDQVQHNLKIMIK